MFSVEVRVRVRVRAWAWAWAWAWASTVDAVVDESILHCIHFGLD